MSSEQCLVVIQTYFIQIVTKIINKHRYIILCVNIHIKIFFHTDTQEKYTISYDK